MYLFYQSFDRYFYINAIFQQRKVFKVALTFNIFLIIFFLYNFFVLYIFSSKKEKQEQNKCTMLWMRHSLVHFFPQQFFYVFFFSVFVLLNLFSNQYVYPRQNNKIISRFLLAKNKYELQLFHSFKKQKFINLIKIIESAHMDIASLDSNIPLGLPLGFADQVMQLEIKLEEQQSLQLLQILTQMYKIAVDFYIDNDVKKAAFFQRKLNNLAMKAVNATSVQQKKIPQKNKALPFTINRQIDKYKLCQKTYVKTLVQNNQKQQTKIKKHVEKNIKQQQDKLQDRRMLRRVKSQEKLFNKMK